MNRIYKMAAVAAMRFRPHFTSHRLSPRRPRRSAPMSTTACRTAKAAPTAVSPARRSGGDGFRSDGECYRQCLWQGR